MRRNISVVLSAAWAGLLLAGCAGVPQVVREGSIPRQITGFYTYGAGDRDLRLIVRGDPFALPPGRFDQAVERGLSGGGILQPPTHPRLSPGPSARPNFALVVDFTGTAPPDLCQPTPAASPVPMAAPAGPSPLRIDASAAFCVSGEAVSEVRGRVTADSPEAPAFQALMHQLGAELFRPDEIQGGNGGESGGGGRA